jgi:hypothetical protein
MYMCKYAGSPLTYGETAIYKYIHLTVLTDLNGVGMGSYHLPVASVWLYTPTLIC